ncbi:unnamed protein product [Hermetia illucens]|uniref:Receptor expression-enhancing protein n=1 Tax=Hermetia illucens TaxID=343691 RepID=A0A7R8UXW9_HERIL|nr:uncharacterized protein LOC119656236 isoform X2 [Hermetia illucens]CAD7089160.1 unnamed protein product [Hermetia illucens]
MISAIISRVIILLFGTLYPAYASYKAVRTKNVKEYVKWMMYWIVYAFFTCIETFTDIFLSWFPFYYEIKVLIVIWLLSPATKGSSTLYRKFVHPMLTRREPEIDEYINQAKEKGYTAVLQLGSKGVNYATNVIMQTALKGGGNLVQTIRRSYSLSDLSEPDDQRTQDEIDEVGRPQRLLRPRSQTVRSSSGGRNVDMYFSEVDVGPKAPQPNFNYMRSSDDISSGYSSAEPVSTGLSRTASLTNATRPRFKAKRAEDDVYFESDENEAMPEVRRPSTRYPHYPQNPDYSPFSRLATKPQRPRSEIISDWRNETFFENEKYFQDLVLENLVNNRAPDILDSAVTNLAHESILEDEKKIPKEILEGSDIVLPKVKDEITKSISAKAHAGKAVEEGAVRSPDGPKAQKIDNSYVPLPEGMTSKYDLFCKWLKDNEKRLTSQTQAEDKIEGDIPIQQQLEDEFKDTLSGSDEEYLDTQAVDPSTDQNPKSLLETVLTEKLHEQLSPPEAERKGSSSSNSVEGEASLPSILEDFNASRKGSASEVKRPATHHKGKAPEPPQINDSGINNEGSTSLEPTTSSNDKESVKLLDPSDLPETVMNINAQLPSNDSQRTSRSPSPRPDSKSKSGRMNLFKNYLPSLFRSESPKPNSSDNDKEDHHKETQI